ncbi:SRPBCC family protein [Pedobacter heparinus]|uniref:Activator of Hsp90 ATPase 1 family protein n=1 Tax=Pedobacter heparinus (strain ATCC 13125 / DSM 2366 / CIP 104194 / JCM 7457 / NBRC 12017 / NCIMB 9290 / NRRL B-14731 / HIM 762-3) TaxID=485917 RepID=C6XVC6_PEDHD|nr:SRPBCC family protein [Pedobacter heparinus]ACU03992.1 Activator of Hsp90 ATPase 1 family protein [Pedobacter heparinus DSM 2366]
MGTQNLIAKAEVLIAASTAEVWQALIDPALIKKYMFGTTVQSDWKKGSKITWQGEWKGKKYEDKGEITAIEPNKVLQYTHFSPLSGLEDKPENYHTVTIGLSAENDQTKVVLTQDKNLSEKGQQESQKNWENMLQSLKEVVESN